ncbi:SDR family oxidoreductase [Nonomuraea roseoviolacea]|uniref:NAD(P)-dependent dehydrogenase (Short-subunit alcohol dehydrogenase family) n=1 Tax=Nonomuraea roseoviolacea subsp. carminata TaxID=160689 RepID=A0ABT1KG17_9ACTN|nr:SDR family oxidoreductase [Nonomuraea roseoviolacea]MCP2351904.1 NAD(P)-dependent dehydrogenase (short-subunit alcohol dehydrogenase family) [Nonomuraea roseoviolacea subsp. carminata]
MVAVALVTGANKGIGFEVARLLAESGVTAIVGARDEERGRAAAERLGLPFVRLDVTDAACVRAAAAWVEQEYGRLDILVNNAGITFDDGPPSQATTAEARQVYETNVFGVIEVTNAMLPLLRRSPAGRIVNVSSERGSFGRTLDQEHPLWPMFNLVYCSSKAALNMITVSYAKELWDTPIKVNAVDPGWVKTDINHNSGIKTPEEGATPIVAMALLDTDGPTAGFVQHEGPLPW